MPATPVQKSGLMRAWTDKGGVVQVVRHERASVKADMWSYGILVWELISDQDITNLQPLAIAQAMQASFHHLT